MIYKVKGPDGRIIQVKGPDNATPEQIKYAAYMLAKQDTSFQASKMLHNIPASAGKFVSDIYETVAHPIDTVTGVGKVGAGYIAKGLNLLGADIGSDLTGPADAVNKHYADRYGSIDKFKKSAEADPIGVLSDIALSLYGGGAALKAGKLGTLGRAVSTAGEWVDPLAAPIKAATSLRRTALASKAGTAKTEQMYQQATSFKDVELMREALKRNINPTLGPAALANQLEVLSKQYDALLNSHTGSISPTQLFSGAGANAIDKLGHHGVNAGRERAAYYRTLRDLADELGIIRPTPVDLHPAPPLPVTAKDLHELKVDTNQRLYTRPERDTAFYARSAKHGKEQAMQFIARRANALAEHVLGPTLGSEYAALNKEYGTVKQLRDQIAGMEARLLGQADSHHGLRGMVTPGTAGSAGYYVAGPAAGFLGMLAGGMYRANLQAGRRIKRALNRKALSEMPKTKIAPRLAQAVTIADLLRALGEWLPEESN